MTYKQQLLDSIEREIHLIKQLIPFIEEKDLDYRPHEKVRNTHELMQYLSGISSYILRWMIQNDITPEVRAEIVEHRKTLTIANFSERLDAELAAVRKYFDSITDNDLITMVVELPWKEQMKLGSAILNAPVKWLAAYRMELFVYLKVNGHSELSTRDAWVPIEATPAAH